MSPAPIRSAGAEAAPGSQRDPASRLGQSISADITEIAKSCQLGPGRRREDLTRRRQGDEAGRPGELVGRTRPAGFHLYVLSPVDLAEVSVRVTLGVDRAAPEGALEVTGSVFAGLPFDRHAHAVAETEMEARFKDLIAQLAARTPAK